MTKKKQKDGWGLRESWDRCKKCRHYMADSDWVPCELSYAKMVECLNNNFALYKEK